MNIPLVFTEFLDRQIAHLRLGLLCLTYTLLKHAAILVWNGLGEMCAAATNKNPIKIHVASINSPEAIRIETVRNNQFPTESISSPGAVETSNL